MSLLTKKKTTLDSLPKGVPSEPKRRKRVTIEEADNGYSVRNDDWQDEKILIASTIEEAMSHVKSCMGKKKA